MADKDAIELSAQGLVTYISSVLEHYDPVINWLLREMEERAGSTYLLGIHGAQGTGKTTLSELFRRYLHDEKERSVVCISIDDFYRTRQERQETCSNGAPAISHARGPPGTHDIDLALEAVRKTLRR